MFLPDHIHKSWNSFLSDEILNEITTIENSISPPYNPESKDKILRFLTLDLSKIKIVWLGQDVYPGKGVATGRAFEAGNIKSWLEPFKQVSLKNILRLIHKTYEDIEAYEDILSYTEIKEVIKTGAFSIKPYDEWFDALEKQGVLLLNTSFTCQTGQANSHKTHWLSFSEKLLTYISENNCHLSWFLWGKEAEKFKPFLKGTFYESRHPMMCSSKYENDFLKASCFKDTMDQVNWLG